MGRDQLFPGECTPLVRSNAAVTVERVNEFLKAAREAGCTVESHPRTGTPVSSGWRPPQVNAATPSAAVRSKHMTGEACDIYDPDGDLDDFAMTEAGQATLAWCALWHEHPSATKGWIHLQTRPPRSGKRTFYP